MRVIRSSTRISVDVDPISASQARTALATSVGDSTPSMLTSQA